MSVVEDDIFDESVDDNVIAAREWQKIESGLVKDGYRDGLTAGQESQLQDGFNRGFAEASVLLLDVSKLRGEICAALAINEISNDLTEIKCQELQVLIGDVRNFESKCIKMETGQLQQIMEKGNQTVVSRDKDSTESHDLKTVKKCNTEKCCQSSDSAREQSKITVCTSVEVQSIGGHGQGEITQAFDEKKNRIAAMYYDEIQIFKSRFRTLIDNNG